METFCFVLFFAVVVFFVNGYVVSGAHFTLEDNIDCNTCPLLGVPRVGPQSFIVGGFLCNSKKMVWRMRACRI